jgi:pimeloyl-ACP methyl ester carboxylesterase
MRDGFFGKWFTVILSAISVAGCDMQNNMLYYPDLRMPSEAELAAKGLQFWPAGPVAYRGFTGARPIENAKGTVIVFHGNAGSAADRDYYLSLERLGYRVVLAEYPGYGGRRGKLGEAPFVSDALSTLAVAAKMYPGPIYLSGESLGCGVVAAAARSGSPTPAGIILITPWNTLLAVARDHYPYLPVGLLMKDRYDNGENLKAFGGKIAVVAALQDEVIPIRHARELFALLPEKKKLWLLEGAGHNDWPWQLDVPKWQEIMDFVGPI